MKFSGLQKIFQSLPSSGQTRLLGCCPEDRALLIRSLDVLFPSNFPPEEAEEAPALVDELKPDSPFTFLLSGEYLDDPARAKIKGLSVGIFFPKSQTGALWFLVTDQRYRQQGIARSLVLQTSAELQKQATTQGKSLRGFFAHIHDPELPDYAENDPFDPRQRVAFYHKLGAECVRLSNFLSPVAGHASTPYLLTAIPLKEGEKPELSKDMIRDHAMDYYRQYAVTEPQDHPDFKVMAKELAALDSASLSVSFSDLLQRTAPKSSVHTQLALS